MKIMQKGFKSFAQTVAALMVAGMFGTFILQIVIRYTARTEWIPEALPILDPSLYSWTLEFCLLLWVWLVFWSSAFVVRDQDHVTFDIIFNIMSPKLKRALVVLGGTIVCLALTISIYPTWEKFEILRLKRTATLSSLFGDWIRMRDIYYIYIMFLFVVAMRYAHSVYNAATKHTKDEGCLQQNEDQ